MITQWPRESGRSRTIPRIDLLHLQERRAPQHGVGHRAGFRELRPNRLHRLPVAADVGPHLPFEEDGIAPRVLVAKQKRQVAGVRGTVLAVLVPPLQRVVQGAAAGGPPPVRRRRRPHASG